MSVAEDGEEGEPVGYRRPPRSTRFRQGRSGNPKGRPRGRHRDIPYHALLGQIVTIREDGKERRVTAAEAFILHLTRKGLAGDSAAARASLAAIETARASRGNPVAYQIQRIILTAAGFGCTLRDLDLATKRFASDQDRVHWLLKPWIVEAALARIGIRQLSADEQREVWKVTHNPEKVAWPDWWTERGPPP